MTITISSSDSGERNAAPNAGWRLLHLRGVLKVTQEQGISLEADDPWPVNSIIKVEQILTCTVSSSLTHSLKGTEKKLSPNADDPWTGDRQKMIPTGSPQWD